MNQIEDQYKTIQKPFESDVYKVKGSKFIAYAFPVQNEEQVKKYINQVKETHYKARHWCYAWQIGYNDAIKYRINDDGEPNNSAGQPILGQIHSFDVTDILIIVVRYFGGTKLGVGGLVSAYKMAAKMVLEKAKIVNKTINTTFGIKFDYKEMDKVLRILKEHDALIMERKMELDCDFIIEIRNKNKEILVKNLEKCRCIKKIMLKI
ncbi:MAG TPA: YigZ family protein [Flavobacteriia bacterium]|nr:YigZ family protein [Flavobacteriia bacterium]